MKIHFELCICVWFLPTTHEWKPVLLFLWLLYWDVSQHGKPWKFRECGKPGKIWEISGNYSVFQPQLWKINVHFPKINEPYKQCGRWDRAVPTDLHCCAVFHRDVSLALGLSLASLQTSCHCLEWTRGGVPQLSPEYQHSCINMQELESLLCDAIYCASERFIYKQDS